MTRSPGSRSRTIRTPSPVTPERRRPARASVLQSDGYRRLFLSAAAIVFGVMGQAVARGWLARDLTGSNAGLGGVMLVFGVAMLVATPWGGVAADRVPKRLVLLVAVGALTMSSLLLGLAVISGVVAYWMLLVASGVQAAAFAFYLPARIAFITDLVAAEQIPEAITLSQTAQEAMRVIAPALAGVMIGVSWAGTGSVFLVAAATSTLAGFVQLGLPRGLPRRRVHRSPVVEMADAVRYVRRTHGLGLIALTTVGVVIVGFPYLTFLPALADERFDVGAGGYGLMSGLAGLGAVAAGVLTPRWRRMGRRPWLVIAASGLGFGASVVALGLARTFPVALGVLAVVGATALVFQTTTMSLMLSLSDLEYHGRLQSMVVLGFSGFGLAALPFGALADAWSLRWVLTAMGAVVAMISVVFAWRHASARRYPAARVELA